MVCLHQKQHSQSKNPSVLELECVSSEQCYHCTGFTVLGVPGLFSSEKQLRCSVYNAIKVLVSQKQMIGVSLRTGKDPRYFKEHCLPQRKFNVLN